MMQSPTHAASLVDVIEHWAQQTPNNEALRFYPQGEGDFQSRSFLQFHQRCQSIAATLEGYQGRQALLFYQSGLEFLEALFACFYAGVIAVPAYPPRKNHNFERLEALISDCQPSLILSTCDVLEKTQAICRDILDPELPWIASNTIATLSTEQLATLTPAKIAADSLAFLQYTSGSTGAPKGVMVSHHNLISNVRMAERAFDLPSNTRCVSWLPLFHDMGLIGAVMMPLYWGASALLMPPAAFLQKPLRWLQLISEAGRETPVASAAPNFAYQLCLEQISESDISQLDLSAWIFALNGAESIRAQTVRDFNQRFAVAGLSEKTIGPSYGMAECTLLASTRHNKPLAFLRYDSAALEQNRLVEKPQGHEMLSSGSSCAGQVLRIVSLDSNKVLDDGEVGEVWLQGEHITQGYWQQEALSKSCFHAYTQDGQGPFLRTGDLGAIHRGELFITGREKNVLVIRGRNHYPQDIEYTAAKAHPSLHIDNTAAFTVDNTGEQALVIVQEVLRTARKTFDGPQAAKAIRNAVAREHGLEVKHIAFIRFASLAKTSSGKVQHRLSKKQFLEEQLQLQYRWDAQTNEQALPQLNLTADDKNSEQTLALWMQQWLAAKAGISHNDISLHEPIDALGLDSVDLIQLSGAIEESLQQSIEPSLLFELDTIQACATAIIQQATATDSHNVADDDIEGFI